MTREEQLAEHITDMRRLYPQHSDEYWHGLEREWRLRWKAEDLRDGISYLAGRFEHRVEMDPDNTDLAALVSALDGLLKTGQIPAADRVASS